MAQFQFQVLHRDLAARNVLVTREEVLKIADFGMTRQCKESDYYRITAGVSVPDYVIFYFCLFKDAFILGAKATSLLSTSI